MCIAAKSVGDNIQSNQSLNCCRQVPGLQPFQHQLEEIYWRFNAYKQTIPTMGAIILDPSMEKCLLVRGWRSADGWGFPTGKINKDEADDACAVREARCNNVFWQACPAVPCSGRLACRNYSQVVAPRLLRTAVNVCKPFVSMKAALPGHNVFWQF